MLTWHREGGIAGFCDDLAILTTGEVRASNCKSNGKTSIGNLKDLISADEMTKFNSWLDKFASVSINSGDNATADAMKVSLILNGNGHAQPTEAEQQEMVNWAQALYTKLSTK